MHHQQYQQHGSVVDGGRGATGEVVVPLKALLLVVVGDLERNVVLGEALGPPPSSPARAVVVALLVVELLVVLVPLLVVLAVVLVFAAEGPSSVALVQVTVVVVEVVVANPYHPSSTQEWLHVTASSGGPKWDSWE